METSRGSMNDTAELIGPTTMASKSSVCVTFWSHMYGDHIGTLNLYNGFDGQCSYPYCHSVVKNDGYQI